METAGGGPDNHQNAEAGTARQKKGLNKHAFISAPRGFTYFVLLVKLNWFVELFNGQNKGQDAERFLNFVVIKIKDILLKGVED
ncbi:hypothetical protein CUMW_248150 [Citrus unshiu]|uniref:Uncharacterized protein n=1 Tax=Citrus unshiu TaxID=55188 RepID=A0A2H5QP24_CITUN|nr:hypothetical protein CUMW_248150 [Citrus unshiu]